jgi:hypothetical protein
MHDSIDVRLAQLTRYVHRGWALVPLHDVAAGACSCREGAACRSSGKHPRAEQWQRPEHLVRDEAGLAAALARWPSCNWGLATGLVSSVWALDYDPRHVQPEQQDAVLALLAQCWEAATWVQRTGSGGLHFLFTLPPDFVPNNGTGRLPAGFDVRGARRGEAGGGQIVIAPSVTDRGTYEVLTDRPPAVAPAMLLESVRPAPPRERAAPVPLATRDLGQVARYVVTAVNGELTELRDCAVSRNARAWRAAARVLELANTGALGEDGAEQVYGAWWAAAAAHPDPAVHVPDTELLHVWSSAERHVGDRPADLTHVGGLPSWTGGDAVYPPSAPAVPLPGGAPGAPGSYPQAVQGVVDNGRTSADIAGQGQDIDPVDVMLSQLLDVEQLRALPPPLPLISGVLDRTTTAWLIGASGSYKSFVALDMAAHVGLGRPWRGHDVVQGTVIYVVAEGAAGMRLRVDAWEREHGPMGAVRFLPMPVQANGPAWPVLVEVCRRVAPVLVIIDTQARVTIGLDENSNSDMSTYAERVDQIKRASGACVLTVHHLGRSGTNARGASAIDGAQDAELRVHKLGEYAIELHMDKQKDQAELPPMPIRLKRSDGGCDPVTGRDLSSLVIDHVPPLPILSSGADTKQETGRRRALALFQVLHDLLPAGGEGITRAEIRALFYALPEIAALPNADARRKAWIRAWAFLLGRGRVMRFGTSQRLAVFPPLDGGPDGMLTANGGTPGEAPPEGWSLMTVSTDKELSDND